MFLVHQLFGLLEQLVLVVCCKGASEVGIKLGFMFIQIM